MFLNVSRESRLKYTQVFVVKTFCIKVLISLNVHLNFPTTIKVTPLISLELYYMMNITFLSII